jgi:hypothetical protein
MIFFRYKDEHPPMRSLYSRLHNFLVARLLGHWLVSPASRVHPLAPMTNTHFQSANFIPLTTANPSLDFNTFHQSRSPPRSDP